MSQRDLPEVIESLSETTEYNPARGSGADSVNGVGKALQQLQDGKDEREGSEPYPSTLASESDVRGLARLQCPVDGCAYEHSSSQGLAGHIPNKSGDGHSWDRVNVSAADLHELASRGYHPDPTVRGLLDGDGHGRQRTNAARDVNRVREWCRDAAPVPIDVLQVYVHPARKRVEIRPRQYLDGGAFEDYREAMDAADGLAFDGRAKAYQADPSWIEELRGDGQRRP